MSPGMQLSETNFTEASARSAEISLEGTVLVGLGRLSSSYFICTLECLGRTFVFVG